MYLWDKPGKLDGRLTGENDRQSISDDVVMEE
jgi:hypothetical protein